MNLTVSQRGILLNYIKHDRANGRRNTWWGLSDAIEAALAEIDARRLHRSVFPFTHGAKVVWIEHKKGRTKKPGVITSHPRLGSTSAHVQWPDGWAGYVYLNQLKVVR